MKPVDQTQFRGDAEHGNCVPACVASILELPLEAVPHFAALHGPYFMKQMRAWIEANGFELCYLNGAGTWPAGAHSIATGKSPRGDFLHSVVWKGRKMAHDPHPSRAGLIGEPHEFLLIVATSVSRPDRGTLIGGTNFCGHGMMASLCPQCAPTVSSPADSTPSRRLPE
jgi:hypothetical protein